MAYNPILIIRQDNPKRISWIRMSLIERSIFGDAWGSAALLPECVRNQATAVCIMLVTAGATACRAADVESWSSRSERRMARATFFKPDAETCPTDVFDLLPLIVMEQANRAEVGSQPARLAPVMEKQGELATGDGVPRIYAIADKVNVRTIDLNRWTFVWWATSESSLTPQLAAVRVTLNPLGHPILWEAVNNREGRIGMFVAKSLESAALREFGRPKEAQQLAVWPTDSRLPTEPVRTLDDGPAPMGPMVYCGRDGNIVTVACRCMPSLVDDIVANELYQVSIISDLGEIDRLLFMSGDQSFRGRLNAWRHPAWAEQLLRWPKEF